MNKLILKYEVDGDVFIDNNSIISILQYLNFISLPKPKVIEWINQEMQWEKALISSFFDDKVFESIEPENRHQRLHSISIDNMSEENASFSINQREGSLTVSLRIPQYIIDRWSITYINQVFNHILGIIPNRGAANCYFEKAMRKIIFKHFDYKHRSFYSPMLFWLQYFGKEELERQGGMEALEANPLLKTERIHDGLLIQVGESPYDAFTPEGEELLINATRSLPPVRK